MEFGFVPYKVVVQPWRIVELSDAELAQIPRLILLSVFSKQINLIFHRLPRHIKGDLEVILCMPCRAHYNRPDERTHIDGPPPMRNQCPECIDQIKKLSKRFEE